MSLSTNHPVLPANATRYSAQDGALDLLQPGIEPVPGYQLVEHISTGGFGEVWKAIGPGGFPVALKFVRLQTVPDAPALPGEVELRGLEVIRTIRHPNLIATFGAWRLEGYLVIAMELADRSLWERFREVLAQQLPGIPRDEVHEYFREAAKGIDYLNDHPDVSDGEGRRGVQHRDIKPQNILLLGGSVKVADFGLARLLTGPVMSHTGRLTPAYAAPEYFRGQTFRESDQYCLAITYCQMRGGQLPFSGTPEQLMTGHIAGTPDLSMLPPEEQPAVERALDKDPAMRWPTCQAFLEALCRGADQVSIHSFDADSDLLHTTDVDVSNPPLHPPPVEKEGRSWRTVRMEGSGQAIKIGLLALLCLVLMGLIVAVFWLLAPPRPVRDQEADGSAGLTIEKPLLKLRVPEQLTVRAGGETNLLIQVEGENSKGPIDVSFPQAPGGILIQDASIPAGTDRVQIPLAVEKGTVPGRRALQVRARSGSVEVEAVVDLSVLPAGRPTLEAPLAHVLIPGESKPFTLKVNRDGLEGELSLHLSAFPPGVTLKPVIIPAGKNEVPIETTAAADAPEGQKEVRISVDGQESAVTRVLISVRVMPLRIHLQRAQRYLANDQYDEAIDEFNEAIRLDLECAAAFAGRGAAYVEKHNPDKGLADCTRALQLDPKLVLAFVYRAEAWAEKKDFAQALADCGKALDLNPQCAEAYNCRGSTYSKMGLLDKAFLELNRALANNPQCVPALVNRALVYRKQNQDAQALLDLDAALRIKPRDAIALHVRGRTHQRLKNREAALADFTEAIRINPKYTIAYVDRGNVYMDRDDEKAKADFEKAIELDATCFTAYNNLGIVYQNRGDKALALANFDLALVHNDKYLDAYLHRGQLHLDAAAYGKALQDFDAAVGIDPRCALAHHNRGAVYYYREEYGEAIKAYSKAIDLEPNDPLSYEGRAYAYRKQGNLARARSDESKARELRNKSGGSM
jgi:tetratricopeptide (TPR) repeat protein/serine/threonine protein kinase